MHKRSSKRRAVSVTVTHRLSYDKSGRVRREERTIRVRGPAWDVFDAIDRLLPSARIRRQLKD